MSKWILDPTHTSVSFVGRHMMFNKVRGTITPKSATIWFDAEQPAASKVEVEMDLTTVNTGVADRDNHLRSPDFFDVANYPTMTFKSTHVDVTGDTEGVITGDLTIRNVTREVKLETEFLGEISDPWGNRKLAFEASARINREDWGLTWNVALEAGGWLVSKDIQLEIEVELMPAPQAQPEASATA